MYYSADDWLAHSFVRQSVLELIEWLIISNCWINHYYYYCNYRTTTMTVVVVVAAAAADDQTRSVVLS
jgi:hypothetical protein